MLAEDRKHRLVSLLILRAEIEIDDGTLALSEQSGYPGALERHLEQRDASLTRSFPQPLMRNFGVVPMTRTASGALVVVARDPSPALADVLGAELATPIELAIAPAIFLERLIQRLAGGVPSALPPELPPIDRAPPSRHRKSVSVIMNVPAEPPPIIVAPSMPMVELPTELIQPGQPAIGIKLELDDEAPAPELAPRPSRPTQPIPKTELEPLLVQPPSLDDLLTSSPAVSTRPTRPSVAVPMPPNDDRPSAPVRATPNIIKRPATPLPIAPQPVARKITEVPDEPEPDPVVAHGRPTYPKLQPPPPSSVFDAETARPHKPAAAKPPPPPRPPTQPPPIPSRPPTDKPRARTTTDNWDDFEDSKVGMGVPPADVLDQMSTIGITPPPVEVPPIEPVETLPPIRPPTAPTRISQPIPALRASTGPQHPRASSAPVTGPQHPRPGSAPVVIPPLPALGKGPPPIPGANIVRDIEKALSRATADRLLMKHAATRWHSLLLVNIAADRAKGARGHGSRLQAGVEAIDVEITSSSLLQAAVNPAGALPDGKDPLFELLGAPSHPSSAPVVVDDQVVAVLAAGDGIGESNPDELKSLASALAVAYQRFPAK